jgi:prevent-host-death family protein
MESEDIGAFEAKTKLSELLERVAKGHRFRITKHGKPVAELRPVEGEGNRPTYGRDKGRIKMRADFDAALDDFKGYR